MELQFVSFRIGGNLFAVDIMRVKEIILPLPVSRLPKSSAVIEGVLNLRGQVIPLLNLAKRLEILPSDDECRNTKYIILSYASRPMAVQVDEVLEVKTVQSESISPPPDVDDGVSSDYLIGVFLDGSSMFMIINPETVSLSVEGINLRTSMEFVSADL